MRHTNVIPCKEMQNIFNDVIIYFLSEDISSDGGNISLADEFFETFLLFMDKNYQIIDEKDMNTLIHNFLYYDKYFIILFDKLFNYQVSFDDMIYNRRIELYLDEIDNKKKDEKEIHKIKEKILEFFSNPKYSNTYDFQYLMTLFKYHNFIEGIEIISEQRQNFEELLVILFKNKKYKELFYIFDKHSPKDKTTWVIGL